MITTLILAALITTAPYQDQTLKDGGTYVRHVAIENTNDWGDEWTYTEDGEFEAEPGQFVQFLNDSWYGWHDVVLKVDKDGELLRTRHNDDTYALDKIWLKSDGLYRSGYYRRGPPPIGTWHNEVWPKAALTIRTNGSDVYATVIGSPSESIVLIGNNNKLHVYAFPGEQSRLMVDRPTVLIKDDGNRVYGYVQSQMTGVFVKGSDNRLIDLTVVIDDAVGDDVARVGFRGRGNSGNRGTRVTVINRGRAYPAEFGDNAFYFDDQHEGGALYNCTAVGFMRGVFGHGATNTRIDRFLSVACETPVQFVPHVTTPGVEPQGNRVRQLTALEEQENAR